MFSLVVFAITVIILETQDLTANASKLPPPPRPEDIKWSPNCTKLSYCIYPPTNYPQKNFDEILKNLTLDFKVGEQPVQNRTGIAGGDIAGCIASHTFRPIYLIKDKNDQPRFVANSENFKFMIEIEECVRPGLVKKAASLDKDKLNKTKGRAVYCHERRLPILFPVLSLDGQTIESVAPKGGISVSCSAKIKSKT